MKVVEDPSKLEDISSRYSHIFRRKTSWELVLLSGAVCGIEFCYAAETAFIGPILLELGLPISAFALTMCLSPLLGFFVTPLLGSLSDTCKWRIGRRRPFIILLSVGMFAGLLLVPNGKKFGIALGDSYIPRNLSLTDEGGSVQPANWGIAFTVVGFVLLDMCCDACQSPSRSYVLDVTIATDHARALTTFTVLSGLGGCMGYVLGGINWEQTALGASMGGHVRTVFAIVAVMFIICVLGTLTSFREMPLHIAKQAEAAGFFEGQGGHYKGFKDDDFDGESVELTKLRPSAKLEQSEVSGPTLKSYLRSIVFMPKSLRILCITNLFSWMSLVSFSLFLTEFVGAVVYEGDPVAPKESAAFKLYQEGVRLGCFGLAMYSVSCASYSLFIERLVRRFGAKRVYVCGQLAYTVGVALMALSRTRAAVLLLSPTAGLMYATQFTMPFILVAHYHCSHMLEQSADWSHRGLGTDVAIVSSMMFPAQLLLSLCAGPLVGLAGGSATAIMCGAAVLSACGALSATWVTYHNL
ncbi:proton-associated sugar transporter A-like [Ixodes scapularis]|uniref:proton-associated sugar transporter A-like n=1 Tax=Ixodes scapularis TaxID=6945 RepID=UPI001A9E7758|nr:proton-associated sugar transporter A-like [Ixodes scapularis]